MLKIPTFEEINGIKEKLSIGFKERNPNEFNKAINLLMSNVKDKKPTKAHKVLADLQMPIITMNIDGLHQKAGSRFVLEIHGNYERNNIVLYIISYFLIFRQYFYDRIYPCKRYI